MNPLEIIDKYYEDNVEARRILLEHSEKVKRKALELASRLPSDEQEKIDLDFIKEASMLHDIGIVFTNAPLLGCFGKEPYIRHGVIGRDILEKEGYKKHALVCERHVGVGITKEDIVKKNLPLPKRDMVPETLEEIIIALADKFFSKSKGNREKSIEEIKEEIRKFGEDKVKILEDWLKMFKL